MEVKAKANHLRISPRKMRLVVSLVRGLEVNKAKNQLRFSKKRGAELLLKLIDSATANAVNNFELDKNNLFIKKLIVNQGKMLKRWMPRAYGRATPIQKKSSHIEIILGEIKDSGIKEGKKLKAEEPIKLGSLEKEKEKEKVKTKNKESLPEENKEEIGKKIIDPTERSRKGHARIEGSNKKGFIGKMFNRKSG